MLMFVVLRIAVYHKETFDFFCIIVCNNMDKQYGNYVTK